jgi:hypothetical protein
MPDDYDVEADDPGVQPLPTEPSEKAAEPARH